MTTSHVAGAARLAARWGVPAVVLAVLVERLGAGPFLRAVDRLTTQAVLAAAMLTAVTTVCAAGRWTWVTRRLGLRLDLRAAVGAYYRSLLVNQLLPGGVLGDVERAVRHGRQQAERSRAARAVAWERAIGQVGLLVVVLAVVAILPSALRGSVIWAVPAILVVVAGATAATAAARRRTAPRAPRPPIAVVGADLRRLRSGGPLWIPLLLSVAAAAGHLALLLVATRTAQVDVTLSDAAPLLAVVLVCSSLPMNLGGWGPREGAAAWVFAAAGQPAADGVTISTVYGLLTLLATAPGVLFLARGPRSRAQEVPGT